MKTKLTDATLEIVDDNGTLYVTWPLETTGFTDSNVKVGTATFHGEWEFEYNSGSHISDQSSPPLEAVSYIGARPSGR